MDIYPIASAPVITPNNPSAGGQDSAPTVTPAVSGSVSPAVTASKTTATTRPAPTDHLEQAIKQVNDAFNQSGKNLYASFEKDKATGITVVQITEKTTKEIVSQIPSKEIIALAQSIDAQGRIRQLMHKIA